ncbi:MAG: deoxyribose-phosphate aldolase [Lentimicrobiaceae bacterium]|nr:deoxyribose-phosphate aldolase [Lentimicrobiaceae bacterium]
MNRYKDLTPEKIDERIAQLLALPSTNFSNRQDMMRFALSCLDLTTLEGTDNTLKIETLCKKAVSYQSKGLPNVAAVCVYPVFVHQAKALLSGSNVASACVAGAFPSGQSPIEVKLAEVRYAVAEGADEIDMVISRGKFLEENFIEVFDEVNAIKDACGEAHLKVILETGELLAADKIYDASVLAMKAGGDFIKTSTGKISPAATPQAAFMMLTAIRDYHQSTGKKVGFKAAGGVSTPEQASVYIQLTEQILGHEWLTPELFRIGASRLADNLEELLSKPENL